LAKIAETNVVNIRFGHLIWGFSIVFPNAWRLRARAMLDHIKEPIDAEMQHCVINAAMPGRIRHCRLLGSRSARRESLAVSRRGQGSSKAWNTVTLATKTEAGSCVCGRNQEDRPRGEKSPNHAE
jgi:hypothetical protein